MFYHRLYRALVGPRSGFPAVAMLAAVLLGPIQDIQAHEGHEHSEPAVGRQAAPRVALSSDAYELVGVLRGDRFVIYLDRFVTNEPVTAAAVAVTVGDAAEAVTAEPQQDGMYVLTSSRLRTPGKIELVFSITAGGSDDLLAGTLDIPQAAANGTQSNSPSAWWQAWFAATLPVAQQIVLLTLVALVLVALGALLLRRRRFLLGSATALAAAGTIALLAGVARGNGKHDHTPTTTATVDRQAPAVVDAPSRLPDASVFVPKTTQRLLELRTAQVAPATVRRAVNLIGRTIADPHRTSLVQSINGGRVIAPEGGLPRVGQTVEKGQLLAQIEPSFPLADRTTIAERIGEIEQLIAVAESKLRRARTLAEQHIVPRGQVIDAEAELDGLRNRRDVLRATRAEPELLRASTGGVIAAARVVPGQVVQAQDLLFQIVDPASLWIEALVYDALDPASFREATAITPAGQTLTLKFQGFSRALQQHAAVVQFSVEHAAATLGIGLPVTVFATSGDPVTALIVPRDAVVRSANGEAIVWRHAEPERFEPQPVRIQPIDAARVAIAAGIAEGERIVVRAADLVNQVR